MFFFSKKTKVFFLLKLTSKFTLYSLFTNLSLLIVKESTSFFIVFNEVFSILRLSLVVEILDINSKNASLKPLSITFCLLKFNSNGSDISRADILKEFAFKLLAKKIFINRRVEKKLYIGYSIYLIFF